jgi:hypothetical protein|tara:strand:- start:767 stop:1030 length:264 start_codon:yes stop_codon:yes gene_type:complete
VPSQLSETTIGSLLEEETLEEILKFLSGRLGVDPFPSLNGEAIKEFIQGIASKNFEILPKEYKKQIHLVFPAPKGDEKNIIEMLSLY